MSTDSAQSQGQDMLQRYRNVFGTTEGCIVLGDIMDNLGHVFDNIDPSDVAMIANRNFALTIGRMAGAFDKLYVQLGIGTDTASASSTL